MVRTKNNQKNNNGAKLGFEETLCLAADKQRGHMDAAEYKHVVLGLIFLKYISDAFSEVYNILANQPYADHLEQSRTLATIRDTILPKLLSGEIRVKNAGKILETKI